VGQKRKDRNHSEDVGMDGKITVKEMLKEYDGRLLLNPRG
jgi:hypothetical protein